MKKIDYTMYNKRKRRRQIYVDIDRTTASGYVYMFERENAPFARSHQDLLVQLSLIRLYQL